MTSPQEQQKKMGQIIARTWLDEDFKTRLIRNPVAVLREVGYALPPGLEIEVVETTAKKAYLVLPPRPPGELSDDELEQIAGGYGAQDVYLTGSGNDILTGGADTDVLKPFQPRRRD